MLPAVVIGYSNLPDNRLNRLGILSRIVVLLISAVLILQFLPININRNLPVFSQLAPGWPFWTSSPSRSLESALFAFCVLGFFLYVSGLNEIRQQGLIRFVLLGFLINVIVGVIQLSYGSNVSIEDLFPFTIKSALFANGNHFSSLVYMMIPLLAWRFLAASRQPLVFALLTALVVAFLFAVGSRAGMAISSALSIFCLIWFMANKLPHSIKLASVAMITLLVLVGFFYFDTGALLEQDLRSVFFSNTWAAAKDHWLTGTGLGSFILVYPMYESPNEIVGVYANHAHNDFLELLLECGFIAVLIFLAYLVQILRNLFNSPLAEAATLSIFSVLVHTTLDYPLRTMAIAIVFATLSAIVLSERSVIHQPNKTTNIE